MEACLGPDAPHVTLLLSELARAHSTPFFVYDRAVFAARVQALRAALPLGSRLLYSVKANPHVAFLQAAVESGCGLEIASEGELSRVLSAGVNPATAIVVGPAKSDALLSSAIKAGVDAIVVESPGELRRLEGVAASMGARNVTVLLRLNVPQATGSLRMAGYQFGMERSDVMSCLLRLGGSRRLRFGGYHGFVASQLLDAERILHNVRAVLAEVATLNRASGEDPSAVDVGGGFGIPYSPTEQPLDLPALAAGLEALGTSGVPSCPLSFESGRFVCGPAGVLVCSVIDTKRSGGKHFVLLDGGINASGIFGGTNAVRMLRHSVIRDGEILEGGPLAHICGPLCTPMDRLATAVPCPAEAGDLMVWWNMGAYGLTAAPTDFLSFPKPTEIVL